MSGKLMQSIRSIPYWNLVKSFTAVGPSMLDILETKDIIQNKSVLFLTNERTDRNTGEQNTFAVFGTEMQEISEVLEQLVHSPVE